MSTKAKKTTTARRIHEYFSLYLKAEERERIATAARATSSASLTDYIRRAALKQAALDLDQS